MSGTARLSTSVVTTMAGAHRLAPQWAALAKATGAGPFASPWWVLAGEEAAPAGQPLLVAVHDGGELVGLGLFGERAVGGLCLVRFLGHDEGTHSLLLADGRHDAAEAVWRELLGGRRRFLELLNVEADAPGLAELRALTPGRHVVADADPCPVVPIDEPFEAYWAARPKHLRRIVSRAEGYLRKDGRAWELEVVGADRLAAVRPELVALAGAATTRRSPFDGPAGRRWEAQVAAAAEVGRLRLVVGRIDGRPACFDLALVGERTVADWVRRYDPDVGRYSPGHLALRANLEWAFASGAREYDLGIGADAYKWRWTEVSHANVTVHAAPSRSMLAAGRAALTTAARLRARWRPDPA